MIGIAQVVVPGTPRDSLFILDVLLNLDGGVKDDTYRRQMHKQLTVQESRHKLARDMCHGKKGTIHQAYRDGRGDQWGSLGLVLNAVVLWTTRYIDAAVAQLRAEVTRSATRTWPGCPRSSTRI